MKHLSICTISLATSLAFSTVAVAEPMSKTQYEFLVKNIEANYKLAEAGCILLEANAKDVCMAQAKGNRTIASAVLEDNVRSTVKSRYDVHAATADSDFSVASTKCNGGVTSSKEACISAAKSTRLDQMADAIRDIRTSRPDDIVN